MAAPDVMVRVVRTPRGGLAVGRALPGRGAWLCAWSASCLDLAERRKAFGRALKGEIAPDATVSLRASLQEVGDWRACPETG